MRQRLPSSHNSHERWLVSYADFITLMFAFFVVLYATSKADEKKQLQVSQSIDSAFHTLGIFPTSTRRPPDIKYLAASSRDEDVSRINIVVGEDVLAPAKVKEDLDQVQKHLEELLADEITKHTVSIQMGKDGLVITLREAGFFASGSANARPETLPVLQQLAIALGKTPYDLRIEGHTDNVPIHNAEFDSNWELSAARATRMTRVFLGTKSILPQRIAAAGYAEFHPVASNDTAAGRGENRRLDLVVLPRTRVNLALPFADSAKGSWRKITDE